MIYKNNLGKKYKLAIISPVPFYYHAPLYRKLAESQGIDLTVYYCSDEAIRGINVEKMYCTKNKFTNSEDLLRGYNYKFLKNYSFSPSFMNWPFGLVNFGLWREIKRNKFDAVVIQAWNNFTWWLTFFACLRFSTPIVFMTDASNLSNLSRPTWKKRLKKIILKNLLFKKAAGFLTSSSVNEYFYKEYGAPEKKMVELHYSYGYENFLIKAEQLKSQRENIRKSFGTKKNDFVLLFVGRLVEEKNIQTLLEAYRRVDYRNKKLFIVGDGMLRNQIEQRIKNLNIKDVHFLGFQSRDSIFKFYNMADALVLSSVDEPWGMVVNEAMCFSLPIIASDKVGAAVDIVKNGYNGFIFPAEDEKKLFECIEKLINLTPVQRRIFGKKSFEIINKWVSSIDPEQQILKIFKLLKNEKNN